MSDGIKKLEPYEPLLVEVATRSKKIDRLRGEMARELTDRRAALLRARDLKAPREALAKAAGVSPVRVSQIMAGGAK